MHQILMAVAIVLAPAWAPAEMPHTDSTAHRVVSSVMTFRRFWMGDDTPFHACSVSRALGHPPNFPLDLEEAARSLLHPGGDPCATTGLPFESSRRVVLNSLRVDADTAHVQLTVIKGEYSLHETYTMAERNGVWRVRDVRILPGIQVYPKNGD